MCMGKNTLFITRFKFDHVQFRFCLISISDTVVISEHDSYTSMRQYGIRCSLILVGSNSNRVRENKEKETDVTRCNKMYLAGTHSINPISTNSHEILIGTNRVTLSTSQTERYTVWGTCTFVHFFKISFHFESIISQRQRNVISTFVHNKILDLFTKESSRVSYALCVVYILL